MAQQGAVAQTDRASYKKRGSLTSTRFNVSWLDMLASLGHEVQNGMKTSWVRDGRIMLRKPESRITGSNSGRQQMRPGFRFDWWAQTGRRLRGARSATEISRQSGAEFGSPATARVDRSSQCGI